MEGVRGGETEEEEGRRDSALLVCVRVFEANSRMAKCVKCGGKSEMRKRDR